MTRFSMKNILSSPLYVSAGLFLLAAGALGFALVSQYGFGLKPCPLCVYQRWPYGIIIVLSLMGVVLSVKRQDKAVSAVVFACGMLLLAGGLIAAYHVGVEQHFWKSFLEGCTVNFDNAADLLAQIEGTKAARCDEIPWSLFGISMAGYNAIVSFVAAPVVMLSAVMMVRRANGF